MSISKEIKFIGFYSSNDKYITRQWDTDKIKNIMCYNDLETKKGIIKYLTDLKIHEDSIKDFIALVKETKKEIKEERDKENKLKNKIRKIVEKQIK